MGFDRMTEGVWADVLIRTERFTLQPITVDDVTPRYLGWFSGRGAKQISVHPSSIDNLRVYVTERSNQPDVLFLAIRCAENDLHIGNLKFEPIDRKQRGAVLGIFIGDEAWQGKGVATETITAAARWLNEDLGLSYLWLGVADENIPAQRAYEKLGFVQKPCPLIPQRMGVRRMELDIARQPFR